jgi:aspartyl-tRNA(Asn)/glutamyl-tRNA(Gln) amidotransferase subunit A
MAMTDVVELTIAEAAAALAAGELSARALVEATLARIEETEPYLHAYASVEAEAALAAADVADGELAAGRGRGPLHGIPISLKDIVYAEGTLCEAGSKAMIGYPSPYDATVAARLRQAGAITVGKVVTHEFATGRNEPPTCNPWAPDGYYAGSSSVGSAVSVAARSSFASIGTDTGGSVRFPATINGVVGLKPTYGRISKHGVIPLGFSLDHVGTLTRTAEDAAIVLAATAGFDPADPASIDEPVEDYVARLSDGVEGLRIGVEREYYLFEHLHPDVRAATHDAIETLAGLGAEIVELDIPELRWAIPIWIVLYAAEAAAHHRYLLRRGVPYDPVVRFTMEVGEFVTASQYLTAQRVRRQLRDAVRDAFNAQRLDAIVAPGLPMPAVRLEDLYGDAGPMLLPTGETPLSGYLHHTFPANLTGQPCVAAPAGFSEEGLPIAIQVLGRPFGEATVLRIAHAYGGKHEWHRRAPARPAEAEVA